MDGDDRPIAGQKSASKRRDWIMRIPGEYALRRERVEHALEVRGVSLRFGGVRALTEVSFGVNDGELFSIIGPNGAGKTSIVNCISGRYRPTKASCSIAGRISPRSIPTR